MSMPWLPKAARTPEAMAAEYADSQRAALAVVKAMRAGDKDAVIDLTDGFGRVGLVNAIAVLAMIVIRYLDDDDIDQIIANSLAYEADGRLVETFKKNRKDGSST